MNDKDRYLISPWRVFFVMQNGKNEGEGFELTDFAKLPPDIGFLGKYNLREIIDNWIALGELAVRKSTPDIKQYLNPWVFFKIISTLNKYYDANQLEDDYKYILGMLSMDKFFVKCNDCPFLIKAGKKIVECSLQLTVYGKDNGRRITEASVSRFESVVNLFNGTKGGERQGTEHAMKRIESFNPGITKKLSTTLRSEDTPCFMPNVDEMFFEELYSKISGVLPKHYSKSDYNNIVYSDDPVIKSASRLIGIINAYELCDYYFIAERKPVFSFLRNDTNGYQSNHSVKLCLPDEINRENTWIEGITRNNRLNYKFADSIEIEMEMKNGSMQVTLIAKVEKNDLYLLSLYDHYYLGTHYDYLVYWLSVSDFGSIEKVKEYFASIERTLPSNSYYYSCRTVKCEPLSPEDIENISFWDSIPYESWE